MLFIMASHANLFYLQCIEADVIRLHHPLPIQKNKKTAIARFPFLRETDLRGLFTSSYNVIMNRWFQSGRQGLPILLSMANSFSYFTDSSS